MTLTGLHSDGSIRIQRGGEGMKNKIKRYIRKEVRRQLKQWIVQWKYIKPVSIDDRPGTIVKVCNKCGRPL